MQVLGRLSHTGFEMSLWDIPFWQIVEHESWHLAWSVLFLSGIYLVSQVILSRLLSINLGQRILSLTFGWQLVLFVSLVIVSHWLGDVVIKLPARWDLKDAGAIFHWLGY